MLTYADVNIYMNQRGSLLPFLVRGGMRRILKYATYTDVCWLSFVSRMRGYAEVWFRCKKQKKETKRRRFVYPKAT